MPVKKADPAKSREVAVILEEQILRSGLRPGWRLPSEEQLCRTHGVSRTVVREAIQRLKARGLVDSRRGGGTYVAEIDVGMVAWATLAYAPLVGTPGAFEEILALRATLEAGCALETTRRKDKDAAGRLRTRLDAMRRARDNPAAFADADLDFHRQLADESGNTLQPCAAACAPPTPSRPHAPARALLASGSQGPRDRPPRRAP